MVTNILEKYYIFSTIDETYIEPSLVFIKSLLDHNDIHLHVHCVNFSSEAKLRYESIINELWTNNVSLVYEDLNISEAKMQRTFEDRYSMIETDHCDALLAKIVIFNRKYKQYMFHLDIDMVVRDSILDIISEHDRQCAGFRYRQEVVNAGVMIFNTDLIGELPDVKQWLKSLTYRDAILDEQYVRELNLSTKNISEQYCATYFPRVPSVLRDSIIYHFLDKFKPFKKFDMMPDYIIGIPLMKEWIDVYDTLPKKYFKIIPDIVDRNRKIVDKFLQVGKRIVGIK